MIGLKELEEMKAEFEREKLFVEAKISVVEKMIEKEKVAEETPEEVVCNENGI